MNLMILAATLLSAWVVQASNSEIPNYYGADFIKAFSENRLNNEELKTELFNILSGGHVKTEGEPDKIVSSCTAYTTTTAEPTLAESSSAPSPAPQDAPADDEPKTKAAKCVEHRSLGYETARRLMFGEMYLKQNSKDQYFVKDVYCEKEFTDDDFGGTKTFGPGLLPKSGNIINTEHTWPQSRFTGRFLREMQKSDIHHLFPTDSEMNSRRGSLRFGRIVEEVEKLKCPQNKLGRQAEGDFVFEVPDSQKGNTARAIFYFATRYQMKVSPPEEETLRQWNKIDPVDDEEMKRNNAIEKAQGNRNPYIDIPDLLNHINHF
jgi:deoxyribonuclease I